jgi:hypothetical protein
LWDEDGVRAFFGRDAQASELTGAKLVAGIRKRSPDADSARLGIDGSIKECKVSRLRIEGVFRLEQLKAYT